MNECDSFSCEFLLFGLLLQTGNTLSHHDASGETAFEHGKEGAHNRSVLCLRDIRYCFRN